MVSNQPLQTASTTTEPETAALIAWQAKLLPFMISLMIALALTFFALSYKQVVQVQRHIQESHEFDSKPILKLLETDGTMKPEERLAFARWETITLLESLALQSRYHQASVATMSRVYIIFLGFITGMVLALVGAAFILGKLREAATRIEGGGENWKVSLLTSSPGLIFALFGTVLMIVTIWARADIDVRDRSIYVDAGVAEPVSMESKPGKPTRSQENIIKTIRPPASKQEQLPPTDP